MEQVFAGTAFMSHLLVELVELLFCCPVLRWVARIQKFYMRCLPFLLSLVGFFTVVWRILDEDDDSESCTWGESKVKVQRQREDDLRLSGRDVETVMERMGIYCSCGGGGGEFKDVVGADYLNCLFEEKEPSLEEVKEAFCVFDRNGDGFIDAEELQRVLSALGFKEGSTVDACQRMIGAYDENRDGRIDFNEFVKFMECSFC